MTTIIPTEILMKFLNNNAQSSRSTQDLYSSLLINRICIQNPRCFKGVNIQLLEIQYQWNSKVWMTGTVFIEYVKWFDLQMRECNALLSIDNCPDVKEGYELCNTKKLFHQQILEDVEINMAEPEKIDILQ
ncbi:hypothetical protein Glove_52g21 [Diversispora epigaea]|uniref:DDE-1 domain-containing protein n=1 Tax=Diversispora epigaea TaxID=1348612 RepID=A0A397JK04_9GLOM|nr:hypothetical protein Glove_52g21 [Diversispora epigaea]